tara:strand:- start:233 stop:1069 length:837 start_codon:yes stop_codon:yes gene_type:complete
MNLILIPVYNDWKSLNKLLLIIDKNLKYKNNTQVLIVDDFSSIKMSLNLKKIKKIKKIEILKLDSNVGSQKAIASGLQYLNKKKRNFDFITIMDGDGEDDPINLNMMLDTAKKNKDFVIVSCRKDRNENLLIKIGYKIHLILTLIFTLNWMSFGNYSCFYHKNLKKILSDKKSWYAYSAAVKRNTNILRVYAVRAKRFFGNSKVKLNFLVNHSLNIIGVFYKRVFFLSGIYIYLINNLNYKYLFLINILILIFNIIIIFKIFTEELKDNISYEIKRIK